MLIKMMVSAADGLGRAFKPRGLYDLPEEDAKKWIEAGYAVPAEADPEEICNLLKTSGAGLLILPGTEKALVDMAATLSIPSAEQEQPKPKRTSKTKAGSG